MVASYIPLQLGVDIREATRLLIAWNVGAWVFLILIARMVTDPRREASVWSRPEDENQWVLVVLGIGLAIYARVYLGRNWGMPMSRKEDPELVTNGPYAEVRHPIYSGIILAMLGSAIGDNVYWTLPLVLSVPYFIYSARREEELMLAQFAERYRDYMRRTKMIVPFVL